MCDFHFVPSFDCSPTALFPSSSPLQGTAMHRRHVRRETKNDVQREVEAATTKEKRRASCFTLHSNFLAHESLSPSCSLSAKLSVSLVHTPQDFFPIGSLPSSVSPCRQLTCFLPSCILAFCFVFFATAVCCCCSTCAEQRCKCGSRAPQRNETEHKREHTWKEYK